MGITATANTSNGCLKSASASFAPCLTLSWLPHLLCLAVLHPGFQIWKSPAPDSGLLFFWQHLPAILVEQSQGLCGACAVIQSINRHCKQIEIVRFLPQELHWGVSSARKAAQVGACDVLSDPEPGLVLVVRGEILLLRNNLPQASL